MIRSSFHLILLCSLTTALHRIKLERKQHQPAQREILYESDHIPEYQTSYSPCDDWGIFCPDSSDATDNTFTTEQTTTSERDFGVKNLPLHNVDDNDYYGTITIGTPPQKLIIQFDTGSADVTIDCTGCTDCEHQKKFKPARSSSFKTDYEQGFIEYGSTNLTGYFGTDSVCIGTDGSLCTDKTQEIFCIQKQVETDSVESGIFGLGFQSNAVGTSDVVLKQLLYGQGCEKPVFAFYLNHATDGTEGELTFCGTDPNHYKGEISYFPVTSERDWQFSLGKVSVGGEVVSHGAQAILDSGTTTISLPAKYGKRINRKLGLKEDRNYPCSSELPDITFEIAGNNYTLTSADYLLPLEAGSRKCETGIDGWEDDDLWILGDVFMRKYYSVFDYGNRQLGLAERR